MFVEEVFGEEFTGGDDADELIAGLGRGGDVVGKVVGVFIIPYHDGAEGAVTMTEAQIADETKNGAIEDEKAEAKNERVDGDGADRKEVRRAKEVKGDNGHDADDRGNEEVADFSATRLAGEDVFGVEPKRGENDNPNGNKEDDF